MRRCSKPQCSQRSQRNRHGLLPIPNDSRLFFKFKELVEAHMEELAHLLLIEHGQFFVLHFYRGFPVPWLSWNGSNLENWFLGGMPA